MEWVYQNPFSNICENWIIFQFLAKTVPVLIIFKNYFLLKFLIIFLLAILLLIFKYLIGAVVWKCQIVKIWSFHEEHNMITIFLFFYFHQPSDHFLTTLWFAAFWQINMCLILLNLSRGKIFHSFCVLLR